MEGWKNGRMGKPVNDKGKSSKKKEAWNIAVMEWLVGQLASWLDNLIEGK